MPLLGLFSRKSRSSKASTQTATSKAEYSTSNLAIDDDEYVAVASPSRSPVYQSQQPASSSKLALPFRKKPEQAALAQLPQQPYLDPLLEPPPRRSSLFQTYQDDHNAYRSTHSLPDDAERRLLRPQAHPKQASPSAVPTSIKKSMFAWGSHKERAKTVPTVNPGSDQTTADEASFNLKSFRHVRPDSPGQASPAARAPSPSPVPPIPTPTPTSGMPSPPMSFQVTSRRPRGNSVSDLTTSPPQLTPSQQKMAAGAFRQAARRSATSLSLTDSPVLSPVRTSSDLRTSLDDRPPPSLLLQSQARPGTPTRPPRELPPRTGSPYASRPSPSPSPPKPSSTPKPVAAPFIPKPAAAVSPAPRTRRNAFATSSSSSSSSSEDEDEDSESTSDAGDGMGGAPRISRRRTIKQGQGQRQVQAQPRVDTLPPLSASVRDQIQRATPPAATSSLALPSLTLGESLFPSSSAGDVPRAQSSIGLYGAGAGTRPRASLSVGALTPSAKEARASAAVAANARLMATAPRPRTQNVGSDTSESAESASDSDEDAPLSTLVAPRRPDTSLSSRSAPATPKKPLVDLEAPSSLTGRPVKASPPLARDEDPRQRPRVSVDVGARARATQAPSPQSSRTSQAPSPSSRLSQVPPPQRLSGTPSSRTLVSLDTPTTPSFSGSSGRQSSAMSPNAAAAGGQPGNVGTRPSLSPVAPPTRPFARRESPASSTGDSSSGKAPLTPRDGSDTRSAYSGPSPRGRPGVRGHGRKSSVTFEDERELAASGKGKSRERDNVSPLEARRRERRRSEARAAIELGNVVNGPPPVDEDDVVLGQQRPGMQMQGGWPPASMQMPMQMPMPPVPPMFNMNMPIPSPGGYGFPPPPPGADPAFLAAHQQAMAIAKQTFQYAVAQQALAAANDEWERSSNVTGFSAAPQQWGYGMGMRQSTVFAPSPRSMYAGSVGGGGGGGWGGTGSVYGEAFGPAAAGPRASTYSQFDLPVGGQRPTRPRTKTAPSASVPPIASAAGRMPAPPSSFRGAGH